MSRVPKWKLEKTKVKVVFRLQFHATHVRSPTWVLEFVSNNFNWISFLIFLSDSTDRMG